jgi:SAM-dependent methyltransferase
MNTCNTQELQRIYAARFKQTLEYRQRVWRILIDDFFHRFVRTSDHVLDLGCGYGEFISQVRCRQKYAMDVNPDVSAHIGREVTCLSQDCSRRWPLPDNSLDVVFTSNFFEHLPDKTALGRTLDEIHRCLKSGGRMIAMGPNIKYLPGSYWDFWDHYLPLTEKSLREAMESRQFKIEQCFGKFLPYTMVSGYRYPVILIRIYLRLRPAWRVFGKQFLVLGVKKDGSQKT